MRIRDHIDKIAWSALDKGLFIGYGFVYLFQLAHLDLDDAGLYALLTAIHTFAALLSETSALQPIIQFGVDLKSRKKANLIAMYLHIGIMLGSGLLIFLFRDQLALIFKEPRILQVALVLPLLNLAALPRTYCLKFFYRETIFNKIFVSNFAWLGGMTAMTVYFVWINPHLTFTEMAILNLSGTALSSIVTVILARKYLEFSRKGEITVKKFLRFSIPLTGASSLHNMPRQLDVYLIQLFTNTATVGIYTAAKTLYRLFDSISDAAVGLLYAPVIRKVHANDNEGLLDLMSKAISAVFVLIFFAVFVIEIGGAEFIISFLPARFAPAIGQFKLMSIAALGIPFMILATIMTSRGDINRQFFYTLIAASASLLTFVTLGSLNLMFYAPLGLITYSFVYGSLCLHYSMTTVGFRPRMLLSSLADIKNLVQNKMNSSKNGK